MLRSAFRAFVAVWALPAAAWGGMVYSGTTSSAGLSLRAAVPAVDFPPGPDPVVGGGSLTFHDAVVPVVGVTDHVSVESVGYYGTYTADARGSAAVGSDCGAWAVSGSGAVSGLANALIPSSSPGTYGAKVSATSTFVTTLVTPVDATVSVVGRLKAHCSYHLDRVSTFYVGFSLGGPEGYEYIDFRSGSITSNYPMLGIDVDLPLAYTGSLLAGAVYRLETEVTVFQEDLGIGTRPEITGSWEFSLVATPLPEPGPAWWAAGVGVPVALRRRR